MKQTIIDLIRANKISSTEVADALGKKGLVPHARALNAGLHRVGEVEFVYAFQESNWETHQQIQHVATDRIIYVHGIACGERAILGDLVAKYLILYKKAEAIVVSGLVRDAHRLIKENHPIWSHGVSPIGCFNRKNETQPDEQLLKKLTDTFQGGIMVCDDTGVVLISPEDITQQLYERLKFIELQEDIWFFCLDVHKMTTYEIVCEKKYLKEEGLIDSAQLEQLAIFSDTIDGH